VGGARRRIFVNDGPLLGPPHRAHSLHRKQLRGCCQPMPDR
jgi:hypothetical protein